MRGLRTSAVLIRKVSVINFFSRRVSISNAPDYLAGLFSIALKEVQRFIQIEMRAIISRVDRLLNIYEANLSHTLIS